MTASFLSRTALVAECGLDNLPGIRPHPSQSLAGVSGVILETMRAEARGTVVLALDGLTWGSARAAWTAARLECVTSTFPSTSVTAWATAIMGVESSTHLGIGMVCRIPRCDCTVHVVANRLVGFGPARAEEGRRPWTADELISPRPTLFEHARECGVRCVALAREMDRVPGPWTAALFRGAERAVPSDRQRGTSSDGAITDHAEYVAGLTEEIEGILGAHQGTEPLLLWVYVNLDDHIHLHGYDATVDRVLLSLESMALRWLERGWSVLAHSDHGQVPCQPDPGLVRVWHKIDAPAYCRMPSGGAGRVRWLYPKPEMEGRVTSILSEGLGDHAVIASPDDIAKHGLWKMTPELRERAGEVIVVAISEQFPVPNPRLRCEHGAVTEAEMLVPLAMWSPG